jgi:hypothetical protein
VGSHKANEDQSFIIPDRHYQSVIIAFYVKHCSVFANNAGVAVLIEDVCGLLPVGFLGFCKPGE